MAIGKNAKKRAARRAFHDAPDGEAGVMPYSFKIVRYIDGKPHVVTFASLTSYKEYRERFFASNPTGTLSLVNPLSDKEVADKGQAFRAKIINQGADTSKAKPKAIVKGIASQYGVKGKRFDRAGTEYDALQSIERDKAKALAIAKGEVRPSNSHALHDIRQRYRKV